MFNRQCKLCSKDFSTGHGRQVYCPDCLNFPKSGKVMIYGLSDGRDGAIRYVGSTAKPVHRYTCHLRNHDQNNRRLSEWRARVGDRLQMVCLKIVAPEQARREEEIAIRRYPNLFNHRAAKRKVYTQEQAMGILRRWSIRNE